MPLEYKPNFTSASGGGGFVTGYHGTSESFTPKKAPDFEGAMKTLAGVVEDYKQDAFEQGKLDQIAGEIDNDKLLFKDAYLAGAEYATSFQKLSEFQAFVADESNKALGRGESAEEFYARISPKIAEYRDSYARIKNVNPEAGSLLTNNLMNVATGALQNYGTARLERAYEHRRAGSVTTATASIISPLQRQDVSPEMVRSTILQTIPALQADAKSMGVNVEQYISDVLIDSFKNVVTGLNFNEPTHQAWVNVMQGTIRELVDGGVIDRVKSTELLGLVQGRIKEATNTGINQILLRSDESARAGKYTKEQWSMDRASILVAQKQGADIGLVRSGLASIEKNYANSNKDANVMNHVPTDTDSQNRQATAFVKSRQGITPTALVQDVVSTIKTTKNPAIAEKVYPTIAENFVSLMSGDPKEGPATERDLDNLHALAYSYDNTSSVVNKNSVYKNNDVRDFLLSRENRALMYRAASGDTSSVTRLREKWSNFMVEGKKALSDFRLTEDDTYSYIPPIFDTELEVKHADVELAVINSMSGSIQRYSPNILANKEQYIGRLESLIYEGDSGLRIMSPMDYSEVLPSLYNTAGVDPKSIIDDALVTLIRKSDPTGSWKPDDLVVRYEPKQQQWIFYDGTQDATNGVATMAFSLDQNDVDRAIEYSIRKQYITDQEKASRSVVAIAYSQFDDKAEAPSLTVVNTPRGRVGVVNVDGFTMSAMLQGLSEEVEASVASDDVKNTARTELGIARGLGTYFRDDSSLRRAIEACTGMDYDTLVANILSEDTSEKELDSDYDDLVIDRDATSIAIEGATRTASEYYTEQIKARAGVENSADIQYTTSSGSTVDADGMGKVTEFILDNVRTDTNPWGEKNLLKDDADKEELKDTLLNAGRIADSRLQATVRRTTGRRLDDWIEASKSSTDTTKEEAKRDAELKSKVNMTNEEHRARIKSLRRPLTIYGAWNKTIFGDLGTEFARELERDEGFVIDWVNTRSPEDQKNPNLKQVEIIGLGVVRNGFPRWSKKFEAVVGDADAISRLTAEFAVDYYNNVATKLDAYGFNLKDLQTKPELKSTLFALGSYLWHGGKYSNDYYKAMQLATKDLNGALKYLQKTAPYKEAGNDRKRRYADGLRAVATATIRTN